MNFYKKCTLKLCYFLVFNATLASDNPSHFRKNLLERIEKLIMTFDDKTRDEKLQYNIDREAETNICINIWKIDKCELSYS